MGNCQAAEAATVLIVHPGCKIERIYWSISAREVMNSNPGHYVAQVVKTPVVKTVNGLTVKQLKLLRPDNTLLIGQVYRLVSYQDVMKEYETKKCVKLGKLLMELGVIEVRKKKHIAIAPETNIRSAKNGNCSRSRRVNGGKQEHQRPSNSGGHWKPALKSISELGS